jgi:hypothetical protein
MVTVAVACLLLGVGGTIWYLHSPKVAPGLTPLLVRTIETSHRQVTLIDGGSRRDAHALWERYNSQPAIGTPPKAPRLLGISLARVEGEGVPGSGTFWIVYTDGVWMRPMVGNETSFGREVVFIDPTSLRVVGAEDF